MSRSNRAAVKAAVIGLGVVIAAAAIVVGTTRLDDAGDAQSAGPIPSLPSGAKVGSAGGASAKESGRKTKLGLFEPIRGWIVYPIGDGLEAVNPADPSERHTLKLLDGFDAVPGAGQDGGNRPSPAGWTADGSRLALFNEYSGDHFVLNPDGSIAPVDLEPGGCCAFVTEPWLSPDGRIALEGIRTNGIRYVELESGQHLVRTLDPPVSAGREAWQAAWSTDGARIAFVTVTSQSAGAAPEVHVADIGTGAHRSLGPLDAGHIRHIMWSPDDSQILAIAGEPLTPASLNPLVHAQPTRLLLVDTDGSGIHEIASGYYVAAAWSPDGSQIAAIEYTGLRRLVVMDAGGTGKRVLVELPSGELFTGVAWHPLPAEG